MNAILTIKFLNHTDVAMLHRKWIGQVQTSARQNAVLTPYHGTVEDSQVRSYCENIVHHCCQGRRNVTLASWLKRYNHNGVLVIENTGCYEQ